MMIIGLLTFVGTVAASLYVYATQPNPGFQLHDCTNSTVNGKTVIECVVEK